MSTPKTRPGAVSGARPGVVPGAVAILAGPLIALLLWGSIAASSTGLPLPNARAEAAVRGTAINLPTATPTPTPGPTRRRIILPGPVGTLVIVEPQSTPTPTPRRRPTDGIVALTPGVFAPECSNGAEMLSAQPIQLVVVTGTQFQVVVTLKNTGSCAWGPGFALAFQGKDMIGANPLNVDSGSVPAGAAHTFLLNMVAPAGGGYRVGMWAMKTAGGTWFGPSATIVVGVTQ